MKMFTNRISNTVSGISGLFENLQFTKNTIRRGKAGKETQSVPIITNSIASPTEGMAKLVVKKRKRSVSRSVSRKNIKGQNKPKIKSKPSKKVKRTHRSKPNKKSVKDRF